MVEKKRLHLGCGNDYKQGWINVDFNKHVRADYYLDLNKKLPFLTSSIDEVLLNGSIEHVKSDKFLSFMEELYRVCKNKAIIKIWVAHYSGMYAFKALTHYRYFGIGSFGIFDVNPIFSGERYSNAYFKVKKEKLLFFHHELINFPILSKLPINWIFNFGGTWQLIMERFQFFGFDEIYYELEVVKREPEAVKKENK